MIGKPDIVITVDDNLCLDLDFACALLYLDWQIDIDLCLLDHSLAACSALLLITWLFDHYYWINDNDFE